MKLSFSTIIIMAVSVALGLLSFGLFHQYIPTMTEAKYYEDYRGLLQTEADKMPRAKARVAKAKAIVQAKANTWNAYVATRTPESDVSRGGINLAVNPYQLTVDTVKFQRSIQRAVNEQVKKGGVKVVAGPIVPALADTNASGAEVLQAYYGYGASGLAFPVVIQDLGPVTVEGTYGQIMANVRAYKSMPHYLAVADGLAISGTSPHLRGTYNLSIVGFIRGKEIFPTPPAAAAPAGGAAGAGGARGFGPPGGGPPSFGGGPRAGGA